jgi:hypothetical protein
MRSVTTFSTQGLAGALRLAGPRRRARLRGPAPAHRVRRHARGERAPRGARPVERGERRNDAPRLRPEPMLRGFLPLCRH